MEAEQKYFKNKYNQWCRAPKGENHWRSKLRELDVQLIRGWLREGYPQQLIAKVFHVHQTQISCISRKKTWGWLEDPYV